LGVAGAAGAGAAAVAGGCGATGTAAERGVAISIARTGSTSRRTLFAILRRAGVQSAIAAVSIAGMC